MLEIKNSLLAAESGYSLRRLNSLNSLICHPSMHAPSLASEMCVDSVGVVGARRFCHGGNGVSRLLGTARVDGLHDVIRSVSARSNSLIRGHTECNGSFSVRWAPLLIRVWYVGLDLVEERAGERLAFAQQLSGRVHVGTWAGGNNCLNLRISQEKEIMARCAVSGFSPRTPFVTPVLPGPGSDVRMKMEWKLLGKTRKSRVWFFRDAGGWLGSGVWPMLMGAVDWVRKGSYHTSWAVPCGSLCTCSYAYGRGPAVGSRTGERCWPLLAGVWRAIAPLMKPWCAEGEVPTAPNLNLYRGLHSRVGWHCDDEPLFGEAGCSKLIVSVCFGSPALFRWKGKSCPDGDVSSCYFGHGDILVMDMLHANVCAGFFCYCYGEWGFSTFWVLWGLLGVLCEWEMLVLLVLSLIFTGLGSHRCASCWTRSLGGGWWGALMTFVTSGKNAWQLI